MYILPHTKFRILVEPLLCGPCSESSDDELPSLERMEGAHMKRVPPVKGLVFARFGGGQGEEGRIGEERGGECIYGLFRGCVLTSLVHESCSRCGASVCSWE